MSPTVVSRDFNNFSGLDKSTLRISNYTHENNFKLKKTYATTVARFGGACYNRCAGSYLSSYRFPATNLLLNFINNSTIPYRTTPRQRHQKCWVL